MALACVSVFVCVCVCVCVCLCLGLGASFDQVVLQTHLYGRTGILGLGRTPLVLALLGQACVHLSPSTSALMHLGRDLAFCPRTTLEVGWWLLGFHRASSTVLVQRACHRHGARGAFEFEKKVSFHC